jgi:hypothetical protein
VQWHINRSMTLPDPREQTPAFLSYRLMLFSLAAVQTVSAAATHLLFDLYSFPPSASLIPELRDEVLEVLKADDGAWTFGGLNKMVKLDSAIRESMRLSCFGTRGCTRKVRLLPLFKIVDYLTAWLMTTSQSGCQNKRHHTLKWTMDS